MAKKRKVILGLSMGHGDSSAALIVDGALVAAAEEERFTRIKHYALFPLKAAQYCMRHAGISPKDVQIVACARRPYNALYKKLRLLLLHPHLWKKNPHRRSENASLKQGLKALELRSKRVLRFEHHLAHLASARSLAPQENVDLLSFDGLGDFVSTAIATATKNKIKTLDRVYYPHSIGFFYTAMTQYLGFPYFGDEFKVMGLSAYGKPRFIEKMRHLIREDQSFGFRINLEAFPILTKRLGFYIQNGQPATDPFYNRNFLTQLLAIQPRKPGDPLNQRHRDLAKSVQVRFEEIANHLLSQLAKRGHSKTIALAGGCSHNSVWVGKIPQSSPYNKVYVAPASHDAGIAVGAAILANKDNVEAQNSDWALLGPDVTPNKTSRSHEVSSEFTDKLFSSEKKLITWLVDRIAKGMIIGVFHGRMEFGPRALGSRSILCDPRAPTMKDRLNQRVKHREPFRPFAASVLSGYEEEWFQHPFDSPTMEAVFVVKEKMRRKIPAIVHADNTCRIQSVHKKQQPFFWKLLDCFRTKTGVPMLINTSFNDCEPIVCTEEDALRCFENCDMDHLVLGKRVISRERKKMARAA